MVSIFFLYFCTINYLRLFMKNICIVVGARPNFVKVAPLVRAINKSASEGLDISCQVVYAGREDDPTLESSLFADLQISRPDVFLGVDSLSLNEITSQVMSRFDQYLENHSIDCVIVVDDLASTMAAAIVTKKRQVRLAHLVAGTRSFDMSMPKEINRLVIDSLSDLLFTAGVKSNSVATREQGDTGQTYLVGNILMDTLRFNHDRMRKPAVSLPERYLVLTLNRRALLADEERLKELLAVVESCGIPVVAPLRDNASAVVRKLAPSVNVIQPLSYLEFGWLAAHALGIITDSGNVAEEATFNQVPCVTLNGYTEHIESVTVGSNELVDGNADKLRDALAKIADGKWKKCALPDRWDGRTAERIVQILLK